MCHLILSTCKVFFFFDFNFADWLDFHHNCLFQASHACGCKSILHSSFTSDLLVYAACSPASPVWHVYQSSPPASLDVQHHICIWNLFFFFFFLICKTASLSPSKAFQRAIAALTPPGTIFPVVPRLCCIF